MNVSYKHLNARLKIGEFTVGQWATVFVGVLLMLLWGFYFSPLSPYPTIITAVYLGGLPIALAMIATYAEFSLWRFAASAWRWALADGRYAPGAGAPSHGYVITPDPRAQSDTDRGTHPHPDLTTLWS